MGKPRKVENTKLPGGLLGGIWFALGMLILFAALVSLPLGMSSSAKPGAPPEQNTKPDCNGKAYYAYEPHCR